MNATGSSLVLGLIAEIGCKFLRQLRGRFTQDRGLLRKREDERNQLLGVVDVLRKAQQPSHDPAACSLFPVCCIWVFDRIGEILHEADQRLRRASLAQGVRASNRLGGLGLARRIAGEGFDDRCFADQIGLDRGEAELLRSRSDRAGNSCSSSWTTSLSRSVGRRDMVSSSATVLRKSVIGRPPARPLKATRWRISSSPIWRLRASSVSRSQFAAGDLAGGVEAAQGQCGLWAAVERDHARHDQVQRIAELGLGEAAVEIGVFAPSPERAANSMVLSAVRGQPATPRSSARGVLRGRTGPAIAGGATRGTDRGGSAGLGRSARATSRKPPALRGPAAGSGAWYRAFGRRGGQASARGPDDTGRRSR